MANPLTREEIIGIVGPLPDERIVEIIATGADAETLTEAYLRLTAEDDMGGALAQPVSGLVARLIDILEADEPAPEEERA